jgi:dipeptide/tripeptide permease
MGGKTGGGWIGSMVMGKRRAVLGGHLRLWTGFINYGGWKKN